MANDFFNWIRDTSRYATTFGKKILMRSSSMGYDYTDEKYKQVVSRVVGALHPKSMRMEVSQIIEETASVKTLRLVRTDDVLPPFRPGQYVNLFCEIDGVMTSRPYSISSAPGEDHLDLTIRRMEGGFVSNYLMDVVKKGDTFETTGPAGSFYYEPLIDGNDLVFLAGGSGVTPFMGMIRHWVKAGTDCRVTLIYGSRTEGDVIFGGELEKLAGELDWLNYELVISEPKDSYKGRKGFIDSKLIGELVPEPEKRRYYICGPNAMYDFCIDQMQGMGVPKYLVRRELYGPPDDVTKEPGWPEEVKSGDEFTVELDGKSFKAKAGEPLMNSLERNGIVVKALCRSGECSYCRMKLVSGKVYMPPHTGLRESDNHYGYIHACVSYPVKDVKVRV